MKKTFIAILLIRSFLLNAQTFKVDTLQYSGNVNKYINFVIMGDGFTSAELNTFHTHAVNFSNALFTQAPWSIYKNYINVFSINVISAESGAKHPNTASDCGSASPQVPVSNPKTYFNCTFDYNGIHRLIVPTNNTNISNVLSTNFPAYDQVIILSNTSYYGGSGGSVATASIQASSNEITFHECGHSFAGLSDEYYAGDIYAGESANMTKQTSPTQVKWKNWMNNNGIGIYPHCCGGNSSQWFRPHNNCKMRYLGVPFCSVCIETIIERIHAMVSIIDSYTPATLNISKPDRYLNFKLTKLLKPIPNTLKIEWKLDGNIISNSSDSLMIDQNTLTNGSHTLLVNATDTTLLLRVDNHATKHISSVAWTINKTPTNINVRSASDKLIYTVYPNPSTTVLNVSAEIGNNNEKVTLEIVTTDGKLVKRVNRGTISNGKYFNTINIEKLPQGTYLLRIKVGNVSDSQIFVKGV